MAVNSVGRRGAGGEGRLFDGWVVVVLGFVGLSVFVLYVAKHPGIWHLRDGWTLHSAAIEGLRMAMPS